MPRDPDQVVQGIDLPVLDAVLSEARAHLAGNAIAATVRDAISPEAVADNEDMRAADALIAVNQLLAALPPRRPSLNTSTNARAGTAVSIAAAVGSRRVMRSECGVISP